jgi:hypothetical protein
MINVGGLLGGPLDTFFWLVCEVALNSFTLQLHYLLDFEWEICSKPTFEDLMGLGWLLGITSSSLVLEQNEYLIGI